MSFLASCVKHNSGINVLAAAKNKDTNLPFGKIFYGIIFLKRFKIETCNIWRF